MPKVSSQNTGYYLKYKHPRHMNYLFTSTKTKEYVKKQSTFSEKYKFTDKQLEISQD